MLMKIPENSTFKSNKVFVPLHCLFPQYHLKKICICIHYVLLFPPLHPIKFLNPVFLTSFLSSCTLLPLNLSWTEATSISQHSGRDYTENPLALWSVNAVNSVNIKCYTAPSAATPSMFTNVRCTRDIKYREEHGLLYFLAKELCILLQELDSPPQIIKTMWWILMWQLGRSWTSAVDEGRISR